ncbi:hypothetical protein, partial [Paracoccus aestuariivivens]
MDDHLAHPNLIGSRIEKIPQSHPPIHWEDYHLQDIPGGALRDKVLEALWLVGRLLEQTPKSKDRIYSLHEPE